MIPRHFRALVFGKRKSFEGAKVREQDGSRHGATAADVEEVAKKTAVFEVGGASPAHLVHEDRRRELRTFNEFVESTSVQARRAYHDRFLGPSEEESP